MVLYITFPFFFLIWLLPVSSQGQFCSPEKETSLASMQPTAQEEKNEKQ